MDGQPLDAGELWRLFRGAFWDVLCLVRLEGFEPPTLCSEDRCSIH